MTLQEDVPAVVNTDKDTEKRLTYMIPHKFATLWFVGVVPRRSLKVRRELLVGLHVSIRKKSIAKLSVRLTA